MGGGGGECMIRFMPGHYVDKIPSVTVKVPCAHVKRGAVKYCPLLLMFMALTLQ